VQATLTSPESSTRCQAGSYLSGRCERLVPSVLSPSAEGLMRYRCTIPNTLLGLSLIALVVPACASAARGSQADGPHQPAPSDQLIPPLPLESPAIAEIAALTQSPPAVRDVPREIHEARAEQTRRRALEATTEAIQKLAAEHKQDLSVMLVNQKRITGRVLSADTTQFILRARYSHHQSTIRYSEVREWRVVPTAGNQALQN